MGPGRDPLGRDRFEVGTFGRRPSLSLYDAAAIVTAPETITKRQICALREEADDHRDYEMVRVCDVALSDGLLWGCRTKAQERAIAECARVISYAEGEAARG